MSRLGTKPIPLLGELIRFVNALLSNDASGRKLEIPTREFLEVILSSLAALMNAVPSDVCVRQLLLQLIDRVPIKSYLDEQKGDLKQCVKAADAEGYMLYYHGISHDALAISCHECARIIKVSATGLPGSVAGEAQALINGASDQENNTTPEGPAECGLFLWEGKQYEFAPLEWRFLHALWDRKLVEEQEVRDRLYGPASLKKKNALTQLQNRVQKRLLKYNLPFSVTRPKPLWLLLNQP